MTDLRRLLPDLTEEDLNIVASCKVQQSRSRQTTIGELVAGWAQHVDRFACESTRSLDDKGVWAEHDFVGALFLRDRLALALSSIPAGIAALVEDAVSAADRRFESITTSDESDLLQRVIPPTEMGSGWWWRRVAKGGPVLEALRALPSSAS